jgi:transcriptional regulator with XRE-family HTH domain
MTSARRPSQTERAQALGARLRQLRREAKLNLKQVAVQVPMSDGNLSRIENGRQGPPSDETVERLARALGADPTELLELAGRTRGNSTLDVLQVELGELREIVERGLSQLTSQANSNCDALERIEQTLGRSDR